MPDARCDLDTVVRLVETCKADVNARDKYGQTPLHFAAIRGSLDVVKYLVEEHKVDVNTNSDIKYDALRYAIAYGHLNIVKYLVEKCNVNAITCDPDPQNITEYLRKARSLHVIHIFPHYSKIRAYREKSLVEKYKVNPVATLMYLHCAAQHGYLDIVKYLLKECKTLYYVLGDSFQCIGLKDKEKIEEFVEQCATGVDMECPEQATVLLCKNIICVATKNGHLDIVKFLIEESKPYFTLIDEISPYKSFSYREK